MNCTSFRRWVAVSVAAGGVVLGCSGPQPLSVAIRTGDEQAYLSAIARHRDAPKEAFFEWKAGTSGKPVPELVRIDESLSTNSNPFRANSDPDAVSRGAVIYKTHCMRCHGEEVRGRGPDMLASHPTRDFHAFDKRFAVTLHGGAPRAWFKKIADGYGDTVQYPDGKSTAMPAFGDKLSREQIWLAITYLQSLDMHARTSKGASPG